MLPPPGVCSSFIHFLHCRGISLQKIDNVSLVSFILIRTYLVSSFPSWHFFEFFIYALFSPNSTPFHSICLLSSPSSSCEYFRVKSCSCMEISCLAQALGWLVREVPGLTDNCCWSILESTEKHPFTSGANLGPVIIVIGLTEKWWVKRKKKNNTAQNFVYLLFVLEWQRIARICRMS